MSEVCDLKLRLDGLVAEAVRAIDGAVSADLGPLRARFLGKKSELKALLKQLGGLSPAERPAFGAAVNAAVALIEERLDARAAELASSSAGLRRTSGIDYTRPGFFRIPGLRHPIRETLDRITEIFLRLGYGIAEGPDNEDDAHNFTDLNFPIDHPARDAQDTFFHEGTDPANPWLLRTHTSPVQIRVMAAVPPPLAVIVPGRTYRCDAQDATHSPIFHQVEGLVVGPEITMADLKGTLEWFTRELFGADFRIRMRPSFFPFTEPSAEVDVWWVGKGAGGGRWLEILGAGMVDPHVLEAVCRRRGDRVYDPERVTGFAFGMGVERVAMLRHGIDDIRLFTENDPRFLEQFP